MTHSALFSPKRQTMTARIKCTRKVTTGWGEAQKSYGEKRKRATSVFIWDTRMGRVVIKHTERGACEGSIRKILGGKRNLCWWREKLLVTVANPSWNERRAAVFEAVGVAG